jgi:hypothetical protein
VVDSRERKYAKRIARMRAPRAAAGDPVQGKKLYRWASLDKAIM